MRSPVNRVVLLCCALVLSAGAPAWSAATARDADPELTEAERRDREAGRFAIGLAITSGMLINEQAGAFAPDENVIAVPPCFRFQFPPNPNLCNGNPAGGPIVDPAPFLAASEGTTNSLSPNVGLSLELMTPALDAIPFIPELPGRPRAFVTAEILPTFADARTVMLQGSATEFILPENRVASSYPASAIAGTGARLTAEVMTTVLAANLGVAFGFEMRDRLLRIKPSVGWIRWGVVAEGKALDAYKDDPVLPQISQFEPRFGANTRFVELTGRRSQFFHAVGPGLELEMELPRRGNVRPVLYASGFAYRTVTDQDFLFREETTAVDPLGEAEYFAQWSFAVADWSYRAAIGFRLRWVDLF